MRAGFLAPAALAASLAPGGLRSLVWTDAASAAAGFATMGCWSRSPRRAAPTTSRVWRRRATRSARLPGAPLLQEIAAAAAAASLFAFVSPALAVGDAGRGAARGRDGAAGARPSAARSPAALGDLTTRSPTDSALRGADRLPAGAGAGARGAVRSSRALGLDLLRAPKRLSVLGSRRMASVRFAVLVGAAAAAVAARPEPASFRAALSRAGAVARLCGAFAALSALPGRGAPPASAALIVSLLAAVAGTSRRIRQSRLRPRSPGRRARGGHGGIRRGDRRLCADPRPRRRPARRPLRRAARRAAG